MENIIRYIIMLALFCWLMPVKGQTVIKVDDPHIVSQAKRQVYYQWGNWLPKPKYVLGVQVNPHYTTVWGWIAPKRNRDYRNGADIRPLSPTGLQTQRYASTLAQQNRAEEIYEEVVDVHNAALKEEYHISHLSVPADPLYMLYYKKMLEDLEEFNHTSTNYLYWGFPNLETYQRFESFGLLKKLRQKIEVLKEKYEMAKKLDMARGKRIMMYHECLIEWRKQMQQLAYMNRTGRISVKADEKIEKYRKRGENEWKAGRSDAEIFVDTYLSNPYK